MALVYEDVKKEDWDLYNSFVPSKKANDCSMWVVDREKKIYVYTESHSIVGGGTYMWINRILIYKMLDSESEIVEEIVDTIKAALQIQYENPIKFQKIVKPTFEEER